ncbi:MAG: hypothetical protein ABI759_32360 [Candidatus Solibacter sp.]
MIAGILVSSFTLGGLALAATLLFRRLGATASTLPVTAQWISELSTDRYRPMARLLDASDIEFMRLQPGYTRKLEAKLRAERCRIFRGYLACLDQDFGRVCLALKLVLAHSQQDRPDLAAALIQNQVMFASGLVGAHFRVVLYRLGVCTVDAADLVKMFDAMRGELRTLVPAEMPSFA